MHGSVASIKVMLPNYPFGIQLVHIWYSIIYMSVTPQLINMPFTTFNLTHAAS